MSKERTPEHHVEALRALIAAKNHLMNLDKIKIEKLNTKIKSLKETILNLEMQIDIKDRWNGRNN